MVRLAVSMPPTDESVVRPSTVLPRVKLTVPDGTPLPLAGFTVAVRTVEAVWAIVLGFAETSVVVATAGAVTVTLTRFEVAPANDELPA
jgi:hypothetical protein